MQILRQVARNLFRGLVITCLVVTNSLAHPGSGIVVDRQGQVYFVDTGQGVWKLDTQGRLTPTRGSCLSLDDD